MTLNGWVGVCQCDCCDCYCWRCCCCCCAANIRLLNLWWWNSTVNNVYLPSKIVDACIVHSKRFSHRMRSASAKCESGRRWRRRRQRQRRRIPRRIRENATIFHCSFQHCVPTANEGRLNCIFIRRLCRIILIVCEPGRRKQLMRSHVNIFVTN